MATPPDRDIEAEILRSLRGRARILVDEDEFLAPVTIEAVGRVDAAPREGVDPPRRRPAQSPR